jgi:hypothetical protein
MRRLDHRDRHMEFHHGFQVGNAYPAPPRRELHEGRSRIWYWAVSFSVQD